MGFAVLAVLTALLGWSPPASAHSTVPAAASTVPAAASAVRAGVAELPGFGPKTVVMTTCALPASTLDWWVPDSVLTAQGPAGGVYGFASCRTKVPGAIYFFLSRA
ncbi:MAG TPA: hypothetical protein VFU36_18840, partial [Jatrophihabitans sp.]|nr:hypothetical protein [Jatrophihabitans sp.]